MTYTNLIEALESCIPEGAGFRTDQAAIIWSALSAFKAIERALPPCPTCGGEGTKERRATPEEVDNGYELGIAFDPCPDCKDTPGKVSIEWMAHVFTAVWSDEPKVLHPRGPEPHHWVSAMGDYLRSIR